MKTYRVVNTATYSKRLILGSRTEQVKAKGSIEVTLTPAEYNMARSHPDLLVSEVDLTPQQARIRNRNIELHFEGAAGTVAPPGERKDRPLYEHFMVELFGLKSKIASLERTNTQLEAKNKQLEEDLKRLRDITETESNDLAINIVRLEERIRNLEKRPVQVVQQGAGQIAPSELLNVEANPQEANRAIFTKLVEQNKELRDS